MTHIVVQRGEAWDVPAIMQIIGRGRCQGRDILLGNGFEQVTLLTFASVYDTALQTNVFIDHFFQNEIKILPFFIVMKGVPEYEAERACKFPAHTDLLRSTNRHPSPNKKQKAIVANTFAFNDAKELTLGEQGFFRMVLCIPSQVEYLVESHLCIQVGQFLHRHQYPYPISHSQSMR